MGSHIRSATGWGWGGGAQAQSEVPGNAGVGSGIFKPAQRLEMSGSLTLGHLGAAESRWRAESRVGDHGLCLPRAKGGKRGAPVGSRREDGPWLVSWLGGGHSWEH